jgi:hypothetical protein
MDDNIKRLLVEAELKNLAAGSVFSVQDLVLLFLRSSF